MKHGQLKKVNCLENNWLPVSGRAGERERDVFNFYLDPGTEGEFATHLHSLRSRNPAQMCVPVHPRLMFVSRHDFPSSVSRALR